MTNWLRAVAVSGVVRPEPCRVRAALGHVSDEGIFRLGHKSEELLQEEMSPAGGPIGFVGCLDVALTVLLTALGWMG